MLQITIDTSDSKQNLKVIQEKNKNTTRELPFGFSKKEKIHVASILG